MLEKNFENINNWLKFAEAKNSGIIAINSVLIFGMLDLNINNYFLQYYRIMIILFLLLGITIALLSFIPRLQHPYMIFSKPSEKDNILYFGDIAKYTDKEYLFKLESENIHIENHKIKLYLINQIIINSKITVIKFKQFEWAIWFTLSAFLTPIGAFILYKIRI